MKTIKHIILLSLLFIAIQGTYSQTKDTADKKQVKADQFVLKLKALPGVIDVEEMPVSDYYKGKYEITYLQPLDHDNPEDGYFTQRLFLLHKDFDNPVVVTTEGYAADYGNFPLYQNELNSIVDGNEILIEHRFFSESTPDTIDWQYLTVENAATDHHKIIETFKTLYDEKWISTGISKGGQTALYHHTQYPEDVDFSVIYVAPLNYGIEDGRHEPFIIKNGNRSEQKAVRNFQLELLERKDSLLPMFADYVKENNYTFRIPIEQIYDYCVLEYSFAFWQWVADTETIPIENATNEEIFKHFVQVSGPDYFAIESGSRFFPFFIQAVKELGYYGYDTEPFKDYLDIPDAEEYIYEVFLPDSLSHLQFNPETNQIVFDFIENNDPKMICIYGERDPWSASGVEFKRKNNMIKIVKKGGHHGTRISNLPEEQKEKVLEQIKEWMSE